MICRKFPIGLTDGDCVMTTRNDEITHITTFTSHVLVLSSNTSLGVKVVLLIPYTNKEIAAHGFVALQNMVVALYLSGAIALGRVFSSIISRKWTGNPLLFLKVCSLTSSKKVVLT